MPTQDPLWDYLETRDMLTTLDLTEDEIGAAMRRVSGESVCSACGKQYWQHPYITNSLDQEGRPYLHLVCGGLIAKL